MSQKKRRFDATWLPFGMMLGIAVGIGTGMILLDSLFLGAIAGVLLGLVIGIVLGRTPRRGEGSAEELEDEYVRRQEEAASGPERGAHDAQSAGESSPTREEHTDDGAHGEDGPGADPRR